MATVQGKSKVDQNSPAYTSILYDEMACQWELIDDLLKGTNHMRRLGEKYLPREPNERLKAYKNRVNRSFLYDALQDTLDKHASKPFAKPVSLKGAELPSPLNQIWDNVDRTGRGMDAFARSLFEDAEKYGKTHVYVDFSKTTGNESKAEEEALGARPTFIHISARDMIGWRSVQAPSGEEVLTHVRWREHRTEPDGKYGDKCVLYIREINASYTQDADGRIQLGNSTWRRTKINDDWSEGETTSGDNTFQGIPLVTLYFKQTGFMTAKPPLRSLAETNLEHYQSHSDHRNILRFARIGILFGSGFSQDQVESGITVGVNEAVLTKNEEATLQYVEVTGESIKAGERDLEKLEERMEVLGLQPLIERSGDATATSVRANESKNLTLIQAWIRELEKALETAFNYAAKWMNLDLPEDFGVDIFNDFSLGGDPNQNEFLLNACLSGKLSDSAFLREIKRRGTLGPNEDIEKILEEVKDQVPDPRLPDNPEFRTDRGNSGGSTGGE